MKISMREYDLVRECYPSAEPICCPTCNRLGAVVRTDDRGELVGHPGRHYLCRVLPCSLPDDGTVAIDLRNALAREFWSAVACVEDHNDRRDNGSTT